MGGFTGSGRASKLEDGKEEVGMNAIRATWKDGKIVPDGRVDRPEGVVS